MQPGTMAATLVEWKQSSDLTWPCVAGEVQQVPQLCLSCALTHLLQELPLPAPVCYWLPRAAGLERRHDASGHPLPLQACGRRDSKVDWHLMSSAQHAWADHQSCQPSPACSCSMPQAQP
jgi:hypothetical protein